MQTAVKLPEEIRLEVSKIGAQFGFRSEDEFVKEAVEEKILNLKKKLFMKTTDEVKLGLEKKGIKIEEVLEDFEKQRCPLLF